MVKLTPKQEIFCREYVIDWNATRAALAAGYSKKTSYSIGQENLKKPEIETYIEEIQKDLEKTAGISRVKVLNEYMKLAFSSIAHLHNTWIERKEFEKLSEEQKSCISEIDTRVTRRVVDEEVLQVEQIKIKLYDKQKALESICKMLGYDAPIELDHSGEILIKRTIIDGTNRA